MDMGMFSFKMSSVLNVLVHIPDSGFRNKSVKDNEKEPLSNFRDKISVAVIKFLVQALEMWGVVLLGFKEPAWSHLASWA